MDLTDIIYSNDYINILIQNYVAQSERYQMLFPALYRRRISTAAGIPAKM